jgi:hypothetical protein
MTPRLHSRSSRSEAVFVTRSPKGVGELVENEKADRINKVELLLKCGL